MDMDKLAGIFPGWIGEELLGKGTYGQVFKAVHEEYGIKSYAAIKVITIPRDKSEVNSVRAEGLNSNATWRYFKEILDIFINEIKLLVSLKGTSNIVDIEDYRIIEKTGEIGWDIFIRMELLTSFEEYIQDNELDEPEVIRLGIDICKALEHCARYKVIHRDVKPANLFVSKHNTFKLGDFGIARELEKTLGAATKVGTPNYMAPEISNGNYDATVDIYSLGIVLYQLLNNNRLPFLDPTAQLISYQERSEALEKRRKGAPLPPPVAASNAMADVILKACAFNPVQRYQTASDFKNALESIGKNTYAQNAEKMIDSSYGQTAKIPSVSNHADPVIKPNADVFGRLNIRLRNENDFNQVWNFSYSGAVIIGRDSKCQVILADSSVSRTQCRINLSDGAVVENLSQSNITRLNGVPLTMPALLRTGDRLQCGRVSLRVEALTFI